MQFIQEFKSVEDITSNYTVPAGELNGATIHLAWYGYGDYCGSSLVIYEKNGKLYEVNGSHCSCYGLEDQWRPEETTWEALAMRDYYAFRDEYGGVVEAKEAFIKLIDAHKPSKIVFSIKPLAA